MDLPSNYFIVAIHVISCVNNSNFGDFLKSLGLIIKKKKTNLTSSKVQLSQELLQQSQL